MMLIETRVFARQIADAMDAETYRAFQAELVARPDAGMVVPGGGGIRKIRWSAEGRGKRSGTRVLYFWQRSHRSTARP